MTSVGPLAFVSTGRLYSTPGGVIQIASNLAGDTQNADQFSPQGILRLNGSGTPTSPQFFEVMSRDLGQAAAGFSKNFAYGTIELANNTYVTLVDQADNAAGPGSEALYVNSLIVPAGSTLNLNGLHVYARGKVEAGTVVGGTITQIPDGGSLFFGVPTAGSINPTGQTDTWSFFGRGRVSFHPDQSRWRRFPACHATAPRLRVCRDCGARQHRA